jgi:hypothetical protein
MIASALRSMILNYDYYRTHPEGLSSKSLLKLELPAIERTNGTTVEYAINHVLIQDNRIWDRLDVEEYNQQDFDDADFAFEEEDEAVTV